MNVYHDDGMYCFQSCHTRQRQISVLTCVTALQQSSSSGTAVCLGSLTHSQAIDNVSNAVVNISQVRISRTAGKSGMHLHAISLAVALPVGSSVQGHYCSNGAQLIS